MIVLVLFMAVEAMCFFSAWDKGEWLKAAVFGVGALVPFCSVCYLTVI